MYICQPEFRLFQGFLFFHTLHGVGVVGMSNREQGDAIGGQCRQMMVGCGVGSDVGVRSAKGGDSERRVKVGGHRGLAFCGWIRSYHPVNQKSRCT